jgi:ATP-dependent Zn protease
MLGAVTGFLSTFARSALFPPGTVPPAGPVTQADDRDSDGTSSPWWTFLTPLLPFALLLGFSVYLMNRIQRRRSNGTLIPEAKDFRSGATNQ